MTFVEADHPRAAAGTFAEKGQTAPELSLGAREERELHPSGAVAEVRTLAPNGDITSITRYADAVDDDGLPKPESILHFENRQFHDPAPGVAAQQLLTDGVVTARVHHWHGSIHDPDPETPAVRMVTADGSTLEMHYSAGKKQDPAPGVPAEVHILKGGQRRSTWYTADTPTKQQDVLPGAGASLFGGSDLVVTRTA